MGFPAKNDHFGVFWWYHHLRKHPFIYIYIYNPQRKAIYIYPGSLPSKKLSFLLDDDEPLPETNGETRKPTHKKWWLDFQGMYAGYTANWVIICHVPPFTKSCKIR